MFSTLTFFVDKWRHKICWEWSPLEILTWAVKSFWYSCTAVIGGIYDHTVHVSELNKAESEEW